MKSQADLTLPVGGIRVLTTNCANLREWSGGHSGTSTQVLLTKWGPTVRWPRANSSVSNMRQALVASKACRANYDKLRNFPLAKMMKMPEDAVVPHDELKRDPTSSQSIQ